MKSFKDVEAGRHAYHRDGALNSVHRSSLTVPEIEGSLAEISFINHFLLKRGYRNIGCRVTAVDHDGKRIESRLVTIDAPRVYTVPLTGMVAEPAGGYLVEFFAAENLYIPFPAVMVNHRGPKHLNTVHAYNRVLNDVFEDDAINATAVREASIDVRVDPDTDTFALFTAGPLPCRGSLGVELDTEGTTHRTEVELDVPRLCSREISLKDCFPDLPDIATGTLKLDQPSQFLFYGRMLSGMRHADGTFSANHSYYDSSVVTEYWDDARPSVRLYPFFENLDNTVRMHPIMSPSELAIVIALYDDGGRVVAEVEAGSVTSPDGPAFEVSVNELCLAQNLATASVAAFAVHARPVAGNTPTRVNHQLVHGELATDSLRSSVNVSLTNPNIFVPDNKTGFAWGQVPIGQDIESALGIVGNNPVSENSQIEVALYDESGAVGSQVVDLAGSGAAKIDVTQFVPEQDPEIRYLWYVARAARPDITGYVATKHKVSGNFTGEHSF